MTPLARSSYWYAHDWNVPSPFAVFFASGHYRLIHDPIHEEIWAQIFNPLYDQLETVLVWVPLADEMWKDK